MLSLIINLLLHYNYKDNPLFFSYNLKDFYTNPLVTNLIGDKN